MTVTIRKIQESDKEIFLTLSREFYSSDAVLAPIPESHHSAAFDELMRSEDYLIAYIFEADGNVAGYALLNKTYAHEAGGFVTNETGVRRISGSEAGDRAAGRDRQAQGGTDSRD